MTAPTRLCPITGEPLPDDRYVSTKACTTLAALLTDLPGLMGDLDAALAKQLHFGDRVGGASSGGDAPLPYSPTASEAGYVARQTILVWVDWVAGVRGHTTPDRWSFVAKYLVGSMSWIGAHPDGPQIIDELMAAIRNARRAIDRPLERKYAGVCGADVDHDVDVTTYADPEPVTVTVTTSCEQALYALVGADSVTCPTCGTFWPVQDRRDAMLTRLRTVTLTATQLSRAVDGLGVDVTPERVRKWASRGLISAVPGQVTGPPVYRVGDALDIVAGQAVTTR